MKVNKVFILVFLVMAVGCESKYIVQQAEIRFSVTPNRSFSSSRTIDDVFLKPYYIPLETTKESLIGSIKKAVRAENNYYILDSEVDKVLCFNESGKFLYKLGEVGKGPGEYLSVDDLQVFENIIYVLARDSKKVMLFSIKGEFLNEIKLNDYYSNFIIMDAEFAFFYRNFNRNKHNTNLTCYSLEKGKVISNFHKIKDSQFGQGYATKCFDLSNNSVYFICQNDYNIYDISKKSSIAEFYIDFGAKYSLPHESRYYNYKEIEEIGNKVVSGMNNLYAFDNIILFTYIFSGVENLVVIDTEKEKVLFNGYPDATIKSPIFSGKIVGKSNNEIISVADASGALSNYGSKDFLQAKAKLDFRRNLTSMDNPILVISKIVEHE